MEGCIECCWWDQYLPVAALAVLTAALLADSAVLKAFDTMLDFVASAPATALDAIIVAAETAEAAVLSPPAAAELALESQLAAEGSVTPTLKSQSAL